METLSTSLGRELENMGKKSFVHRIFQFVLAMLIVFFSPNPEKNEIGFWEVLQGVVF